jgi:hypothetical protein
MPSYYFELIYHDIIFRYYWFAETFTTNNPDLIKGLLTQDIERIITILRTAKLFASSDVTAINNAANDRLRKVDIVFALLDRASTDAILARTFQRAIIKFKYVANYVRTELTSISSLRSIPPCLFDYASLPIYCPTS